MTQFRRLALYPLSYSGKFHYLCLPRQIRTAITRFGIACPIRWTSRRSASHASDSDRPHSSSPKTRLPKRASVAIFVEQGAYSKRNTSRFAGPDAIPWTAPISSRRGDSNSHRISPTFTSKKRVCLSATTRFVVPPGLQPGRNEAFAFETNVSGKFHQGTMVCAGGLEPPRDFSPVLLRHCCLPASITHTYVRTRRVLPSPHLVDSQAASLDAHMSMRRHSLRLSAGLPGASLSQDASARRGS